MKLIFKLSLTIAVTAGLTTAARAQINYTGPTYTQDFDSMGAVGTTTPTGWFVGSGTGPAVTGTTVIPGTGSSNTPGNYNFGVSGVHGIDERALGSLTAQGVQLDTEVDFKNGTGAPITQFTLTYDGEQWKTGFFANTLTLQLSTDGITWTSLGSAFNFISPITGASTAALDGNATANRVANIGGTFTLSTPIAIGSAFFFRFADPDDAKTDAGLSVDNFSFRAVPEPSVYMLLGVGLLLCGQRFFHRRSA
jgi:PEP-CTERM motif